VPGGRYDRLEIGTVVVGEGSAASREVRYLRRRRVPDPALAVPLALHRVSGDDRLDLVSARYYGDATAFWRICDANRALDPDDLVAADAVGSVLVVPVPVPGT